MPLGDLETVEMSREDGGSIVYVPTRSNFTRIIVSLTRNDDLWLTHLGWRPKEKSIALPCDNTASGLAIELPEKYLEEIKPTDVIAITCAELGFRGEMVWGGSAVGALSVSPQIEALTPEVSEVSNPSLLTSTQPSPNNRKLLFSGMAVLAVVSVIGVTLMTGGDVPDLIEAEVIPKDELTAASNKNIIDNSAPTPLIDQTNEAFESASADTTAQEKEIDRLQAKAIQEEKDAVLTVEAEKVAAAKRATEKEKSEEKARAEKIQADNERANMRAVIAAKRAEDEAAKAKAETEISSAEIKTMQENLAHMGYYSGAIDGILTDNTTSSVQLFKSIFELPNSLGVDRTLLQRIQKQRELHVKNVPVPVPEAVPAPVLVPAPEAVKAAPVSPVAEVVVSAPAPEVTALLETKNSASDRILPQEDLVDDIKADLVEPVLLTRPSLKYPSRPGGRSGFTDIVTVVLSYAVDKNGEPINVIVLRNDHTGVFKSDFEKTALRVAEKQRYKPGRIGDDIVVVEDVEISIVFQK